MAREEIQKRDIEPEIPTDRVSVAQWWLDGMNESDILGVLEPILGKKKARARYNEALSDIRDQIGIDDDRVAFHLASRQVLYRRCIEISDYKTAHSVLKDIAKIEGIYLTPQRKQDNDISETVTGDPYAALRSA